MYVHMYRYVVGKFMLMYLYVLTYVHSQQSKKVLGTVTYLFLYVHRDIVYI
jgi:hypothetical protein